MDDMSPFHIDDPRYPQPAPTPAPVPLTPGERWTVRVRQHLNDVYLHAVEFDGYALTADNLLWLRYLVLTEGYGQ